MVNKKNWWKEAVVYQVYPRSFMDSNGDGVGDLQGIIQKLDYLKWLGIDVIWICPVYKSPQDDNGYDISDYQDIHHEFGTMKDFDQLLEEVHRRGMKLIIDLVINHTSDEHPWFIEARSSKENTLRDWYIWRDAKEGHEPNNWESIFGGSAWKWDEKTKQYFMHVFSQRQPDLNWENPKMREALYEMIRWWLDKGIDGFRVDAISHIRKYPGFPDLPNPQNLDFVPSYSMHMNIEGIQTYLKELCQNTFAKYDIMTVGEANGVSAEQSPEWVDEKQGKFNMIIQFEHVGLWGNNPEKRVDLEKLRNVFSRWQNALHGRGWNALFVENHDVPRIVSKWGDVKNHWHASATSIATMYFLMEGTPFIYQGQELGMTNTTFNKLEDFDDVSAKNAIKARRAQGTPDDIILSDLAIASRDNARTPMPWNSKGGFTTGKPWMAMNPNFPSINVEDEKKDTQSVLNYYRQLIQLRKEHSLFIEGRYQTLIPHDDQIFAYLRSGEKESALIICNMTSKEARYHEKNFLLSKDHLMISNYEVADHANTTTLTLRPFEARVYKI